MAAVAGELLAEESEAAFTTDSEESASSKGVDIDKIIKYFGEGLQTALAIYDTVRVFKKANEEDDERRTNRYRAGIVYPNENRNVLITKGLIPAYYSTSNIKDLLRANVLPFGWSELTAVAQGFADEVKAGEYRKRNVLDSKRLKEEINRERDINKNLNTLDYFDSKLRTLKAIENIKTKIM